MALGAFALASRRVHLLYSSRLVALTTNPRGFMKRTPIALSDVVLNALRIFDKQWFLLSAGDFAAGAFNTMTISWGGLGTVWGKPMATVFVRPTRYTFEFMNRGDSFTLCAFAEQYRPALNLIGSRSGRAGDKIGEAKLTPEPAARVAAPVFREAELALECRIMYWDDLAAEHFLDADIMPCYPRHDYHRMYFCQVVAASGTARYRRTDET